MASSASALPWLWIIEALANFKQVDTTVLIDLVKRTPEISDGLGKNAREMVSLRILEGFVAKQNAKRKDDSSCASSKTELDLSEHCEDVVMRIINGVSPPDTRMVEQEVLKYNLQAFVMHKRSCLPKFTLQKLKDTIVEGNNPILKSLEKMSGLSVSTQPVSRIAEEVGDLNAVEQRLDGSCSNAQILIPGKNKIYPDPKKADGLLEEVSPIGRSGLDTENPPVASHGDNNGIDTGLDPCVHNAKKLKCDATSSNQAMGQTSVTKMGNVLSEDIFGGNGKQLQHTLTEVSDLAQISDMGGLDERRDSAGGHDQQLTKITFEQMNEANAVGLQHNHLLSSHNNNKVPHGMYKDGSRSNLHLNETKDDGENCAEKGISAGYHGIMCGDEGRDECEKTQLNTSNTAPLDGPHQNCCPTEARESMEHNGGQGICSDSDIYQDEQSDVARKKRCFLSSQCTISQDSLTTSDGAELRLCMKCNKSGQLLVCSANACPLVVHQGCLGSEPSFDGCGNFYCPFCACSRAITEYLEVKKKAFSARKNLTAFIGSENNQLKHGNVNSETQVHNNEDYCNETTRPQSRENVKHKEVEPSTSRVNGNLPPQAEDKTVNDETCSALGEMKGEKMGLECQSTSSLRGQKIRSQAGCTCGDNNLSCRDAEIPHTTNRQAEDITWKEDLLHPISDPSEVAVSRRNIGAQESSEKENDKATSNYSMRFRKQEKQYTYPAIHQFRRKKLRWTAAEVEKLKEGVSRFSNVNDKTFPWKKILEFGSDVFQKGRTMVDLKDKWRNISK
ncbi:hypothetical protein NMG60_11035033 [Bertholletia excelsa]